ETFDGLAPYVETFNNRGCEFPKSGYEGPASNDDNDEMCVKVSMLRVKVSQSYAAKQIQQFSGFKESGIDVKQISNVKKIY
nr:Chain A, HaPE645 alpha-1 subunit [Hemiselmis andersenii]7SUT_E Chain E, HaPE645 alpha-1 subunit [Hemiselmis andersenii]